MRKALTFIFVLVLSACLYAYIYLVANVSATIPSIKEYEYQGNVKQLIYKIRLIASTKSNVVFKVGEVLGSKSSGYAYDATVMIKDESQKLLYELKFEELNDIKTKVLLIGAHNLTNDTGGYGIKAVGMKILLDKLDSTLLSPLQKTNL
jgi:hypothetical protein